jgi:uncharacterized protein YndB with AHSA1/START domain
VSSILVDAPVEETWEAVTDPDALSEWFGADVELEPRPLGKGTFRFPDGTVRFAIVEEVDAPRHLAWRWWPAGDHSSATRVDVALEPLDDDTLVSVVESAA